MEFRMLKDTRIVWFKAAYILQGKIKASYIVLWLFMNSSDLTDLLYQVSLINELIYWFFFLDSGSHYVVKWHELTM